MKMTSTDSTARSNFHMSHRVEGVITSKISNTVRVRVLTDRVNVSENRT
jgi:hypothetical protein